MQRGVWHGPCSRSATIKVKRQHVTFLPFLTGWGHFYTNGTDLLSTLIEWLPNPDPMEQQAKVFKSYKKVMWVRFFFFYPENKINWKDFFSIKFSPQLKKKTDLHIYNVFISKSLISRVQINYASISWYSPSATWTGLNITLLITFWSWNDCVQTEQIRFP